MRIWYTQQPFSLRTFEKLSKNYKDGEGDGKIIARTRLEKREDTHDPQEYLS
jgi:hypothetical protein